MIRSLFGRFAGILALCLALSALGHAGDFTLDSPGVKGLIIFGCDRDYPPLSFSSNEGLSGLDIDIVHELEASLNSTVSIKAGNWSDIIRSLASGDIEAVSGILITPERKAAFDFTIPYLIDQYTIFTNPASGIKGAGDLVGMRLAILQGDAAIDTFITPNGLTSAVSETRSFTEALELVSSGSADYTIAPYSLGRSVIESRDLKNIEDVGRPLYTVEYRFAVQKGNSELLFFLNDRLAFLLESGKIEDLKLKWKFYNQFPDSLAGPPPPIFLGAVLSLFLLAVLIFAIYFTFKRRIRLKTEELTALNEIFQTIVDNLPQRIFWKDKNLKFQGTNRKFREEAGILLEDIAGKTDTEVFESGGGDYSELDRKILEDGLPHTQDWIKESEGAQPRFLRMERLPLINSKGEISGILGCYEDRTEEWQSREQIRVLSEEIAEKNSLIQKLDITDPLSELYNRRYIQQRLAEEAALFSRHNRSFSIILIDIANLSRINKEFGYAAGDSAIAATARLLREFFPSVDVIGRLDGGRFLIILPLTSTQDAGKAAEMVYALVQRGQDAESQPVISLRCVVCGYTGQGVDEIQNSAEGKMREAKQKSETGRVFFA